MDVMRYFELGAYLQDPNVLASVTNYTHIGMHSVHSHDNTTADKEITPVTGIFLQDILAGLTSNC